MLHGFRKSHTSYLRPAIQMVTFSICSVCTLAFLGEPTSEDVIPFVDDFVFRLIFLAGAIISAILTISISKR